MLPIELAPQAIAEAEQAALWAESRRPGRGAAFRDAIDAAMEDIQTFPAGHQRIGKHFRRALVQRFRYVILYRVFPDRIRVVGILCTDRHPDVLVHRAALPHDSI